jgi:putative membrane protein
MIATFALGIWLVSYQWAYYQSATWFWLKAFCVLLLAIYHFICIRIWKSFCADNNTRTHVFYRWFNEFPVLLLIAIVCLVVIKPIW